MLKKHSCTNAEKKIEEAFTLQIIPFYADIYRYFLHLGAESTLAEDMAQDVMVTAWKNRKKLLEINYQKAWLLRVAHNQYISFRRLAEQK